MCWANVITIIKNPGKHTSRKIMKCNIRRKCLSNIPVSRFCEGVAIGEDFLPSVSQCPLDMHVLVHKHINEFPSFRRSSFFSLRSSFMQHWILCFFALIILCVVSFLCWHYCEKFSLLEFIRRRRFSHLPLLLLLIDVSVFVRLIPSIQHIPFVTMWIIL